MLRHPTRFPVPLKSPFPSNSPILTSPTDHLHNSTRCTPPLARKGPSILPNMGFPLASQLSLAPPPFRATAPTPPSWTDGELTPFVRAGGVPPIVALGPFPETSVPGSEPRPHCPKRPSPSGDLPRPTRRSANECLQSAHSRRLINMFTGSEPSTIPNQLYQP